MRRLATRIASWGPSRPFVRLNGDLRGYPVCQGQRSEIRWSPRGSQTTFQKKVNNPPIGDKNPEKDKGLALWTLNREMRHPFFALATKMAKWTRRLRDGHSNVK